MTKKSRPSMFLAAAAALSLGLAGCASAGTADTAAGQKDGVLDVAVSYVPGSLDPGISAWSSFAVSFSPAYASLLEVDESNQPAPGLAESFSFNEDNTKLTFKLREGLKFSDGNPLDAANVVESLEYWGAAGGPYSSHFDAVEGIAALDDLTVEITLASPNPEFVWLFTPDYLAGLIISPTGLGDPKSLGVVPQGAGPYVMDEAATVSGNKYVYVRNPHYYNPEAVEWERVEINVHTDANSAIQALNSGAIDFYYTDAISANTQAGQLAAGVKETTSSRFWTGIMIMDRAGEKDQPLQDIRVRQALNHAVDRATIAKALFGEFGSPTAQVVGEGFTGHDPANENIYPYDPEKARSLLKEAGYGDGFVLHTALLQNPRNQMLTEALSGQLAEVGIQLEISPFGNLADWRQQIYTKEYGITIEGNQFFPSPYIAQRTTLDKHAPFLGVQALDDPRMNELIAKASAATGGESEKAWQDVFRYAVEQAWFVPVSTSDAVYLHGPSVGDLPELQTEVSVLDIPAA